MGRLIVANRRGHQVLEVARHRHDTEEARQQVALAERIIQEARAHGAMVSKKVDGQHVLDRAPLIPRSRSTRLWRPLPGASRLATALAVMGAWWRRCRGRLAGVEPGAPTLERPWRRTWDHLPKRSAGLDFTRADYAAARPRPGGGPRHAGGGPLGAAPAPGLSRRALHAPARPDVSPARRAAHRGTLCAGGALALAVPYLCINPTYPLPEEEFFAHLYLYVRDREDLVRRVAAPQPWDQALGRTF